MNDILSTFVQAIILAFSLIPLDVQNIFVFNQGAEQYHHTNASVVATVICDTILICTAVFALSFLILEILWLKLSISAVGFIFLVYIRYNTWSQTLVGFTTDSQVFPAKKQILFVIWVWFFSLAIASLNIRKLNKSSIILTMINKIADRLVRSFLYRNTNIV